MGKYIQKISLNITIYGSILVEADSWEEAEKLEKTGTLKEALEKETKKAQENIIYNLGKNTEIVISDSNSYTSIETDDCIEQ